MSKQMTMEKPQMTSLIREVLAALNGRYGAGSMTISEQAARSWADAIKVLQAERDILEQSVALWKADDDRMCALLDNLPCVIDADAGEDNLETHEKVAVLKAERDKLLVDTTWQDHADYWQKQAIKAEGLLAGIRAERDALATQLKGEKLWEERCADLEAQIVAMLEVCEAADECVRENTLPNFSALRDLVLKWRELEGK